MKNYLFFVMMYCFCFKSYSMDGGIDEKQFLADLSAKQIDEKELCHSIKRYNELGLAPRIYLQTLPPLFKPLIGVAYKECYFQYPLLIKTLSEDEFLGRIKLSKIFECFSILNHNIDFFNFFRKSLFSDGLSEKIVEFFNKDKYCIFKVDGHLNYLLTMDGEFARDPRAVKILGELKEVFDGKCLLGDAFKLFDFLVENRWNKEDCVSENFLDILKNSAALKCMLCNIENNKDEMGDYLKHLLAYFMHNVFKNEINQKDKQEFENVLYLMSNMLYVIPGVEYYSLKGLLSDIITDKNHTITAKEQFFKNGIFNILKYELCLYKFKKEEYIQKEQEKDFLSFSILNAFSSITAQLENVEDKIGIINYLSKIKFCDDINEDISQFYLNINKIISRRLCKMFDNEKRNGLIEKDFMITKYIFKLYGLSDEFDILCDVVKSLSTNYKKILFFGDSKMKSINIIEFVKLFNKNVLKITDCKKYLDEDENFIWQNNSINFLKKIFFNSVFFKAYHRNQCFPIYISNEHCNDSNNTQKLVAMITLFDLYNFFNNINKKNEISAKNLWQVLNISYNCFNDIKDKSKWMFYSQSPEKFMYSNEDSLVSLYRLVDQFDYKYVILQQFLNENKEFLYNNFILPSLHEVKINFSDIKNIFKKYNNFGIPIMQGLFLLSDIFLNKDGIHYCKINIQCCNDKGENFTEKIIDKERVKSFLNSFSDKKILNIHLLQDVFMSAYDHDFSQFSLYEIYSLKEMLKGQNSFENNSIFDQNIINRALTDKVDQKVLFWPLINILGRRITEIGYDKDTFFEINILYDIIDQLAKPKDSKDDCCQNVDEVMTQYPLFKEKEKKLLEKLQSLINVYGILELLNFNYQEKGVESYNHQGGRMDFLSKRIKLPIIQKVFTTLYTQYSECFEKNEKGKQIIQSVADEICFKEKKILENLKIMTEKGTITEKDALLYDEIMKGIGYAAFRGLKVESSYKFDYFCDNNKFMQDMYATFKKDNKSLCLGKNDTDIKKCFKDKMLYFKDIMNNIAILSNKTASAGTQALLRNKIIPNGVKLLKNIHDNYLLFLYNELKDNGYNENEVLLLKSFIKKYTKTSQTLDFLYNLFLPQEKQKQINL